MEREIEGKYYNYVRNRDDDKGSTWAIYPGNEEEQMIAPCPLRILLRTSTPKDDLNPRLFS